MNMITPNHVAIIIDGNRRWAVAHNLPPWKGHWKGEKVVENFLDWCLKSNIPEISIYSLSTENLKRSKREIEELTKVFIHGLKKLLKSDLLEKYQVRVNFVGELSILPKVMVNLMKEIMQRTAKYSKRVLNFLVGYGGHMELVGAVRKLFERALKSGRVRLTKHDIEKNLLIKNPVDLVIRTGGYSRLSNLLIWQTAYAEFYTTDVLWPEFNKREFMKAIRWFSKVKRNFGR